MKAGNMTYKATLGTTAILITVGVSLLLGAIIAFFGYRVVASTSFAEQMTACVVISVIVALYLIVYLYRPVSYHLDEKNLVIRRPVKSVTVPLDQIADAFIVKAGTMGTGVRVGGNGGVFGFYGNFENNFGLTTWYATRLSNFVLIETVHKEKIILTPDDTGMVKHIRQLKGRSAEPKPQ